MKIWLICSAVVAIATGLAATGSGDNSENALCRGGTPSGWSSRLVMFALACAILGFTFRVVGLGASLWTDEFGTLWAVERDLATTFARSHSFHGQSPLYYSIIWLFVQLFGESEIVLRLPSLFFSAAAALLMFKAGRLLNGVPCGALSASLLWLSVEGLRLTAQARPYALAVFFTALAFYGFILAAKTGSRKGRAFFVLGGVGLVAAHYALAIILLGIGISYLVFDEFRRNYHFANFSIDVLLQAALSVPVAGQLLVLWGRKRELSWIDGIDVPSLVSAYRPELVLLVAAITAGYCLRGRRSINATVGLLAACVATPPLTLILLAWAGTNLVADRYILSVLVPLCLLAAYCVSKTPLKLSTFGWAGWVFYSAAWLGFSYAYVGSFSNLGRFDWRTAVGRMRKELGSNRSVPVLYRSGFIEDDLVLRRGHVPGATTAPLRSPGHAPPSWNIIPVGHNWVLDSREEYFAEVVKPAVTAQSVFYYLSCECWGGADSAHYDERLTAWVSRELPQFRMTVIPAGVGMIILQFKERELAPDPAD